MFYLHQLDAGLVEAVWGGRPRILVHQSHLLSLSEQEKCVSDMTEQKYEISHSSLKTLRFRVNRGRSQSRRVGNKYLQKNIGLFFQQTHAFFRNAKIFHLICQVAPI